MHITEGIQNVKRQLKPLMIVAATNHESAPPMM
jgi:hypothetical protein